MFWGIGNVIGFGGGQGEGKIGRGCRAGERGDEGGEGDWMELGKKKGANDERRRLNSGLGMQR